MFMSPRTHWQTQLNYLSKVHEILQNIIRERRKTMQYIEKWCENGVVAVKKPSKIRGYEAL